MFLISQQFVLLNKHESDYTSNIGQHVTIVFFKIAGNIGGKPDLD